MNTRNRNNNRNSGRFNTPGQFVSAGENFGNKLQEQMPPQTNPNNLQHISSMDTDMAMYDSQSAASDERPKWMKPKGLVGVKKISNKEKRRRQNQTLRRLLTPKNALMILNEMVPHQQVANHFKVEANSEGANFYNKNGIPSFAAELTLDGANYKGFGDNKLTARNAAAEQAIRDIIIKKMNKVLGSEGGEEEDESLPMIQLASFALHKLFTEWEYAGHKVPQLGRLHSANSVSESLPESGGGTPTPGGSKGGKERAVPRNASAMHPCMLLTYLRPHTQYTDLPPLGDKPQNMVFSMELTVDGRTFVGKACSKKEARKEAARRACEDIFGVSFDDHVTANTPLHD